MTLRRGFSAHHGAHRAYRAPGGHGDLYATLFEQGKYNNCCRTAREQTFSLIVRNIFPLPPPLLNDTSFHRLISGLSVRSMRQTQWKDSDKVLCTKQ